MTSRPQFLFYYSQHVDLFLGLSSHGCKMAADALSIISSPVFFEMKKRTVSQFVSFKRGKLFLADPKQTSPHKSLDRKSYVAYSFLNQLLT